MSQKAKHQITYAEPADRPLSLDLSIGEIYALMIHHEKQATRVEKTAIKTIGEWQLKEKPSKRDLDQIKKKAESIIHAHLKRAKGFATLINSHFDFEKQQANQAKS